MTLILNFARYMTTEFTKLMQQIKDRENAMIFFKPGVRQRPARTWFLEIVPVRTSVCVFVCVSALKAINN